MTAEIEIPTGEDTRLLIRHWTNAVGRLLVTVAPQMMGRAGEWRLQHSGLVVAPDVARQLAQALVEIAAGIDAEPVDPAPTAEDRCASRWP